MIAVNLRKYIFLSGLDINLEIEEKDARTLKRILEGERIVISPVKKLGEEARTLEGKSLVVSPEIPKIPSKKLGEEVNFKIKLIPKKSFQNVLIKGTLKCIERVLRGSETQQKMVYSKTVYEEEKTFGEFQLIPGVEREIKGIFSIPADGMCSFSVYCNCIYWVLNIHVAIPGPFPDFKEDFILNVLPVRIKRGD